MTQRSFKKHPFIFKKRASKRKTWARFMQGKWIDEMELWRLNLGERINSIGAEMSYCTFRWRRASSMSKPL